jgi:nucleotide-binding universal stress UspA family protein
MRSTSDLTDRGAQRVIVGVDGSEAALGAASWGAEEAAQHDVSLTLLYVVDRNRAATPNVVEAENQLAETALADANAVVETLQKPIEVEREIVFGDPGTVLLQQSRSAALLCVGAPKAHPHGPSDSLAASVAFAASCSVAVVPPTRCGAWKRSGLLAVCLDASNINYDALQVALEEAYLHGFSVRVVAKESSDPALDELVSKWAHSYPDLDTCVVQSDDILSYISGQHGQVHMVVLGAEHDREAAELIELSRSKPAFYENPAVLVVNSQHL